MYSFTGLISNTDGGRSIDDGLNGQVHGMPRTKRAHGQPFPSTNADKSSHGLSRLLKCITSNLNENNNGIMRFTIFSKFHYILSCWS